MTDAVSPASAPPLGSEFNDFLFAPVGEDRNGMCLSMLSALARMDLDPWQEAEKLARLPADAAIERLTSLIVVQQALPSMAPDFAKIAPLLIARLPRQPNAKIALRKATVGAGAAANSPTIIIGVYLIFTAFMLSAQWIAASRQPPAPAEIASAPISKAFVPDTQTPPTGQ